MTVVRSATLDLGIGDVGNVAVMRSIIIVALIMAILVGIGAAAALWRSRRAESRTGRDRWSSHREIGSGPQTRQTVVRISFDGTVK